MAGGFRVFLQDGQVRERQDVNAHQGKRFRPRQIFVDGNRHRCDARQCLPARKLATTCANMRKNAVAPNPISRR